MFSHDLRDALVETDPLSPVEIVSVVRDPRPVAEPEVVAAIRQDVRSDTRRWPPTSPSEAPTLC
jgi:hypothetical protein